MVLQTGTQIAGQIAGAAGQNQAVKANDKVAVANLGQQYNATQLREQQEQKATQLDIQNVQKQGRSQSSLARTSAGAGGVTGSSVAAQEHDISAKVSNYTETDKQNLAMKLEQDQSQDLQYKAQAQDRIDSQQPVNPLDLGLKILGEGASAGASYLKSIHT